MNTEPQTTQAQEIKNIVNPDIKEFIEKKEQKYNNIFKPKSKSGLVFNNLLLVLLIVSVVGLGSYLVSKLATSQEALQRLETKNSVAGASLNQTPKPISGAGFTILPEVTLTDYKLTREIVESPIIPNRVSINSKLFLPGNQEKTFADLEVWAIEYDNQYNQEQFVQEVAKSLGDKYVITSKSEKTAKNNNLYKIESTQPNSAKYYSFVSTNNYYIILIRNQDNSTANVKFLNNVLSWLYLN